MIASNFEQRLRERANRDAVQRLVVGALISSRGRILLLRRPPDDFMPGILELPSGEVLGRESLTEALHREVAEETALKVRGIGPFLGSFDYLSKSGRLSRQFNFVTYVVEGTIELSEHAEYFWAHPNQANRGLITESTRDMILAFLRSKG